MPTSKNATFKRVSIIGCPGAGKTTFSKEFAEITKLPLIHLDLIYHDQSYSYETDRGSWRKRVKAEITRLQWIIDGNYKSTFDIRLPQSDTIVFLDYPTSLSIWRAIKRRVQFHGKVRTDMPSTWKERLGWEFFVFILKFNHQIAPQIRQLLQTYSDKNVIILKNPRSAEAYLDRIRVEL